MQETIEIPETIEVQLEAGVVTASNGDTQVEKDLDHPLVTIEVKGDQVCLETDSDSKQEKALLGTFKSLIKNIIAGLEEEYTYKLKNVYAHFPASVKVQGDQVVIENFLGEREPRRIDIAAGVSVEVDDDQVLVKGADKEKVGLVAGKIEQACYKGNFDPRKFQDGVYITHKG